MSGLCKLNFVKQVSRSIYQLHICDGYFVAIEKFNEPARFSFAPHFHDDAVISMVSVVYQITDFH